MEGTIIEAGVLLLAHATLWFLVSIVAGRNDVVDVAWGLGGVLLAGWFALSRPLDALDLAVYLPVAAWGLRLSVHLLFVSGIPMLEAKYEGDPEYEAYREATSAFLPRPPR